MLFVWLATAPNLQAQVKDLFGVSAVTPHSPAFSLRIAQMAKLAYANDITFTPSFSTYLPLISVPELTGNITGQITYQGVPIGGISVTLFLWYNPTSYIRFRTATSQSDGIYQFTAVPKLTDYYYRVLYENLTHAPAYAFGCAGTPIFNFPSGASASGGSFEISDITLLSPVDGATITPPYVFQWVRRATASDDYYLNTDQPPHYWQSSSLGYTNQYSSVTLPDINLTTGVPSTWSLSVTNPDGSGCSARTERTVTFANTSMIQFSLPIPLHK